MRSMKAKRLFDESGTFTLESSLLFPVIILTTLIMIFLCVFLYCQFSLYFASLQTAERLAFVWDNSHKSPLAGDFYIGQYDGLYWRATDDGALDWFGFHTDDRAVRLSLGNEQSAPQIGDLIRTKLLRGKTILPDAFSGQLAYSNRWLNRTVSVRLQTKFFVPGFIRSLFPQMADGGEAESTVTEPAEFIRLVDIVRTYAPEIKSMFGSRQVQDQAEQADEAEQNGGQTEADRQPAFDSHAEAKAYLQKLVDGREAHFGTAETGTWRMVDALDRENIAHQAYYGKQSYSKEIKGQLQKDLELMRTSQVSGVVWHFFKRTKDDSIGLSSRLQKELEKNGIIIVIHEEIGGE